MIRAFMRIAFIVAIIGGVFYHIRYNSMSNTNVIPRKWMDEYLTEVYDETFTFCSQNHHYATKYHIWTLIYKDANGNEVTQYYYINTPKSQRFFHEVADYGSIWDTYAESEIKKELEDMYEEVSCDEIIISPEEGNPRYHFTFQIDTEEKIEKTARCLAAMYQRLYEITDKPMGCTLIFGIFRNGELLTGRSMSKISKDIGSTLDEDAFYQYLKSL